MVAYFAFLAFRRDAFWSLARIAVVGVGANLVSIVARGLAADRVPWGNMYEYSCSSRCSSSSGPSSSSRACTRCARSAGFALMFSVLTMAVAVSFLYVAPGPLVPGAQLVLAQDPREPRSSGPSLFALGGMLDDRSTLVDGLERRRIGAAPGAGAAADHGWLRRPRRRRRRAGRPRPRPRRGRRPRASVPPPRSVGGRARPARLPHHRVRVPDLDVRGDRAARSGRRRPGAATGAGTRRRPGRSSRG